MQNGRRKLKFVQTSLLPFFFVIGSGSANAWCGGWADVKTIKTLVAATPQVAEHYQWVAQIDERYTSGRPLLIKAGFTAKLWRDGRFQITGIMGNYIRHRTLDVAVRFRARYTTGHAPVRDWPDVWTTRHWGIGEGYSRNSPALRSNDIKDQRESLTVEQFRMIGDPQYIIGPAVMCWAN